MRVHSGWGLSLGHYCRDASGMGTRDRRRQMNKGTQSRTSFRLGDCHWDTTAGTYRAWGHSIADDRSTRGRRVRLHSGWAIVIGTLLRGSIVHGDTRSQTTDQQGDAE